MGAKRVYFGQVAKKKMLNGVEALANAVKVTLGPGGRNVMIERMSGGMPTVTKDGITVAKEIDLEDKVEDIGAQLVKEAAAKTNDVCGDGTTTATVLTATIFREGLKLVIAGYDPMQMRYGILAAAETAVNELKKHVHLVNDYEKQLQVATISANGDQEIGKLVADALKAVGRDGVTTVEEGQSIESKLTIVEGMRVDSGLLSPYFINDANGFKCVLDSPYIFLTDKKISSLQEMLPLLEMSVNEKRPLLIIAEDIDGDALSALVINKMRGVLNVCAVKAPAFGDHRKSLLEDLATVCGAHMVTADLGMEFHDVTGEHFGTCQRVIVDQSFTTVIDGKGEKTKIAARINQIKSQMESATSDYDREKLESRLARIVGGVALIKVGAVTEVEMKEKKDRVIDALSATKAAVEEGIIPGGGVALLRVAQTLRANTFPNDTFKASAKIVARACEEPIRAILTNAGMEPEPVIHRILSEKIFDFGYDVIHEKYGDLIKIGVVDPIKVTRSAISFAASIASMMLTTEAAIADAPENDPHEGEPDLSEHGIPRGSEF